MIFFKSSRGKLCAFLVTCLWLDKSAIILALCSWGWGYRKLLSIFYLGWIPEKLGVGLLFLWVGRIMTEIRDAR